MRKKSPLDNYSDVNLIWIRSPDEQIARLRGAAMFELAQHRRPRRTQVIEGSVTECTTGIPLIQGINLMFRSLAADSVLEQTRNVEIHGKRLIPLIFDVHFPIGQPWDITSAAGDDVVLEVLDQRDDMITAIRDADAVTCSRPEWITDLFEYTHRVIYLPDLSNENDDQELESFMNDFQMACGIAIWWAMHRHDIGVDTTLH